MLNFLKDKSFLRALDEQHLKTVYAKIIILNYQDEMPLSEIQGRITNGSISINGSSSLRRTCNLTFLAEDNEDNLTATENLIGINKKIKIQIGVKNRVNKIYGDIVWFPLGIFVINNPSISHSNTGVQVSITGQDKMCLLNGTCGGTLPANTTFDSYDQYDVTGKKVSVKNPIYDIIMTAVCNYGGEAWNKIFVDDINLELKQLVRWMGESPIYYNEETHQFETNEAVVYKKEKEGELQPGWVMFKSNENIGYTYVDFVYPKELVVDLNGTVTGVLDKIKSQLGNYEYFYDVDGNFHFQEIKNYLNNSYRTDKGSSGYRLADNSTNGRKAELFSNDLCIIDKTNYEVDFKSNTKSVYTFTKDTGLISSYSNSPNYTNIKNDYHIWGKRDAVSIHYHIAIAEKPTEMIPRHVLFETEYDALKQQYVPTGKILKVLTEEEWSKYPDVQKKDYVVGGDNVLIDTSVLSKILNGTYVNQDKGASVDEKNHILKLADMNAFTYTPSDWRAEMYLRAMEKKQRGERPNMHEQELLDKFYIIYDFYKSAFKTDMVQNPNDLTYFFDYLEPHKNLYDFSIDNIGSRIYAVKQEEIKRLYELDAPNIIIVNKEDAERSSHLIKKCETEGMTYTQVDKVTYSHIAENTYGPTAHACFREALYQHVGYNETINITCQPIYYLDVNTRITVQDPKAGIYGDYIIQSINVNLDGSNMSISATRALERI